MHLIHQELPRSCRIFLCSPRKVRAEQGGGICTPQPRKVCSPKVCCRAVRSISNKGTSGIMFGCWTGGAWLSVPPKSANLVPSAYNEWKTSFHLVSLFIAGLDSVTESWKLWHVVMQCNVCGLISNFVSHIFISYVLSSGRQCSWWLLTTHVEMFREVQWDECTDCINESQVKVGFVVMPCNVRMLGNFL